MSSVQFCGNFFKKFHEADGMGRFSSIFEQKEVRYRLVAAFQSIQASLAWARRTYTKEHISIVAARGRVYHVFMNRWVAEWLFGQENTHPSDCNFKLSSQTRRPVALCGNELLFAKKWKKNDPSRRVHQKIQEICLKILKCDLKPS